MDIHEITQSVAKTAGADFAFVLSQAGLLVTRDAPRDMPDAGRMKILWACPAGRSGEVMHLDMPRQELVPYGGAAPVDVFAMRVEDTAVLVVVMATWNDKSNVVLALTEGAAKIGEIIREAKKARAQKAAAKKTAAVVRRERVTLPFDLAPRDRPAPSEPARKDRPSALPREPSRKDRPSALPSEPSRKDRPSAPHAEVTDGDRPSAVPGEPARRKRTSALPKTPKEAAALKKPARARASSEPHIEIGTAEVGRETMAAIEAFLPRKGSEPDIEIGEAEVGRETMAAIEAFLPRRKSEPEIVVGEAEVGRETLYAIEAALPRAKPGPAPEGVRVELASISRESLLEVERLEASQRGRPTVDEPLVTERRTLPWVDSPASLKHTLAAREAARAAAPPEVKLGVEEMDPDALEEALRSGR